MRIMSNEPAKEPANDQPVSGARGPKIVGLVILALVAVLGVKALADRPRGGAEALPPAIASDAAAIAPLPAPAAVGSPAEAAEIEALVALQGKRAEADTNEAKHWQRGAVLGWNEVAVGLITQYGTSPVVASRVLALVSVAQHDALLAVTKEQRAHKRPPPGKVTPLFTVSTPSSYPSEHAAVAAASSLVLSFLYSSQDQKAWLAKRAQDHTTSRLVAGVSRKSDIDAGEQIGRAVAEQVIARAKSDGADRAGVNWQGTIPQGDDKWKSAEHPAVVPLRPRWGTVRPWLMTSGEQLRPPPPPKLDSPEFAAAIEEVKKISATRTPEQLALAKHWADSPGSPTPGGHWNVAAQKLIADHPSTELAAARVFALMNMAVMDAGIGCWEAKYHYWFLRPSQADPTITLPVGLPNFPSYPSGHSCYSGAAAHVLAHFFPADAERMKAMALDASMSRVYGGIHYKFECEKGLELGRKVGELAVKKATTEARVTAP